jgi:hypothetical protein
MNHERNNTMTCETLQQRLLALPDIGSVPADLNQHVSTCPACTKFRAGLAKLDRLVPKIRVPASTGKAAFVSQLETLDLPPIIKRRVLAKRDSGSVFSGLWKTRREWQYGAGIAAALLIGVGIWWANTSNRNGPPTEVAKLRHELLKKEVAHLATLTKADTATQKIAVWSNVTAELHTEAKVVYKIASTDEMNSLEKMFGRAVTEGLLVQAQHLPVTMSPAEKQTALAEANTKLQAAETETETLAKEAPPQAQGALKKMAVTARAAQSRLKAIIRGEA